MDNEIKVIRKDEYKTSTWSGGTTTQLYIYPEESQYSKMEFLFRISSAKVEVEESVFTQLPGINREIMIIDGELELEHEGHHNTKLSRFDKDRFSGDWTTRSYGKVTDFNLMMNNGCDGSLEHIEIKRGSRKNIELYKDERWDKVANVLYCVNGSVVIELEENIGLYEEDLFVSTTDTNINKDSISICNSSNEDSNIIISRVYF
ncbi:HutD family protein [[Clostridium] dakarense]|uniref:HutD family protein n=1 Tax=Faecalimicrobium dakarense TaxID=1301100 RepID=UPI0004BABB99|nr:HutD family protein [[Clostridium] dakarense]